MSNVIKLLSLMWLIISIFGQVQENRIVPDCITPDNAAGMCINVKYCVSIMTALINNDHITNPEVAKYLRESQCGIAYGSQKVCCNVNSIDFGEEPHNDDENSERVAIDSKKCGVLEEDETPLKWIAELWFNFDTELKLKCLGTKISEKHVIVPAHCVASLPANVSLSHVSLQNHEYRVSKIFIHASYNQPKFANDIAIIELDPDSADSEEINNAICLEMSTTNAPKSTLAIMKNTRSSHQYGKIEFINDNNCSTFLSQQFTALTAGQFCANIQSNETEYFTSFIGAVVLQSKNSHRYTLKAFTSAFIRREQALDENQSYVFTDVEHHLEWIQNAITQSTTPVSSSTASSRLSDENFRDCPLTNSIGRCVSEEECTLYSNAPRPYTRQQEAFLEQIKCISDEDYEDGVCCPLKYINQSKPIPSSNETLIDEKYRHRRGASLLDMKRCGQQTVAPRIVGGKEAGLKEFPWYGLLKYRIGDFEKFTCGSSLISARYSLTCAHCITNLPHGYRVTAIRLGEYDLQTNPDCDPDNAFECNPPVQDIEIEKLIPHPRYNNPRYNNDIGLVRLAREPDMTEGIVPICLPINRAMEGPFPHKYVVTGFGLTEHGRESDVMLKIFVPKVEKETCQSFHRSLITLSEGHECYGGEGVIDSCKGDSGGPAMNVVVSSSDNKPKFVQLGIVAAGHSECGRGASGYPGIYTNVKHYMEWILDNMDE